MECGRRRIYAERRHAPFPLVARYVDGNGEYVAEYYAPVFSPAEVVGKSADLLLIDDRPFVEGAHGLLFFLA
jgi:hypothetical protein